MAIEVLVFEVEGRSYGIPTLDVVEVVRAATLSPLPKRSETVEGLLNLRGRVLPVFDVRRMFQLLAREISHTDHLVVVQKNGRSAALRVDQALDLVQLQIEDEPNAESSGSPKDVVAAIGRLQEGIVHVLDTSRLLAADEEILSLVEKSVTEVTR